MQRITEQTCSDSESILLFEKQLGSGMFALENRVQTVHQGTSIFSSPHSAVNDADVPRVKASVRKTNLLRWRRRWVMVRRRQAESVA